MPLLTYVYVNICIRKKIPFYIRDFVVIIVVTVAVVDVLRGTKHFNAFFYSSIHSLLVRGRVRFVIWNRALGFELVSSNSSKVKNSKGKKISSLKQSVVVAGHQTKRKKPLTFRVRACVRRSRLLVRTVLPVS